MVEYALMLGLTRARRALVATISSLGGAISGKFSGVSTTLAGGS